MIRNRSNSSDARDLSPVNRDNEERKSPAYYKSNSVIDHTSQLQRVDQNKHGKQTVIEQLGGQGIKENKYKRHKVPKY